VPPDVPWRAVLDGLADAADRRAALIDAGRVGALAPEPFAVTNDLGPIPASLLDEARDLVARIAVQQEAVEHELTHLRHELARCVEVHRSSGSHSVYATAKIAFEARA
jgi:hypothetical protein